MYTFIGLRSWGDAGGSEFCEARWPRDYEEFSAFDSSNVASCYCDWNADLFVEEALTEESVQHCVEAKAQGDESRSVGAQLSPADLQADWLEWCPVPQALGAWLVHPNLMGLMLWGVICVILKAGITVQKRSCAPWCGVFCGFTRYVLAADCRAPG